VCDYANHYRFSSNWQTLDGWTRLALVSFRSVALDFDVQILSSLLDFLSILRTAQQRGTEGIQLVVQRDQLIHEIVFHLTLVPRCHRVKPQRY
jgi:hypothetical protein